MSAPNNLDGAENVLGPILKRSIVEAIESTDEIRAKKEHKIFIRNTIIGLLAGIVAPLIAGIVLYQYSMWAEKKRIQKEGGAISASSTSSRQKHM